MHVISNRGILDFSLIWITLLIPSAMPEAIFL